MQTAIYTIAKNEAHNVAAFMKAAEDVPVYVLDTGSTDDTVELLKKHGANVEQQIITPWRFDSARNAALEMVPNSVDYCVSLDMDEVIEPGWQEKLKTEWRGNIGNYQYIGGWRDKEKTIPICIGPRTRLHTRAGFTWERHIHEVIAPLPTTKMTIFNSTVLVRHYQNGIQRNYNPALDVYITENPKDVNSRIQRAAEYMQKKEPEKALEDYLIAIQLKEEELRTAELENNPIEWNKHCVLLLSTAFCYHALGDKDKCFINCLRAAAADPMAREPWMYLAKIAEELNNKALTYGALKTASYIVEKSPYAIIEPLFWEDDLPNKLADKLFKDLLKQEL